MQDGENRSPGLMGQGAEDGVEIFEFRRAPGQLARVAGLAGAGRAGRLAGGLARPGWPALAGGLTRAA